MQPVMQTDMVPVTAAAIVFVWFFMAQGRKSFEQKIQH
jgi:hypothetical protein